MDGLGDFEGADQCTMNYVSGIDNFAGDGVEVVVGSGWIDL